MEEGIYEVEEQAYHSGAGISKHALDHIEKSPAHYKHAKDNPIKPTPAMVFGSYFHMLFLEPERIADEVAVSPAVDRRTKAGKLEYASFVEESKDKSIIITEAEYEQGQRMSEAVDAHQLANELVTCEGLNERAIYSKDRETGLLKRCKVDRIIEDRNILMDLKTASMNTPEEFMKSVLAFGYHVQAAYYLDIAREQGLLVDNFQFVVVQKTPPYAVSIFQLDSYALAAGRSRYKQSLKILKACMESDKWHASSQTDVLTLTSPNYIR